jgi:HEAT repeat protein
MLLFTPVCTLCTCMNTLRTMTLLAVTAGFLLDAESYAAGKPEQTRALIAVLQSEAGFYEKARACQQLGDIGTKDAVSALALLLGDEHLSAYARAGLEGIPDASAVAALRSAAATLKGNQRAGVINSLGILRDAKSVDLLSALATSPESGVATEALLALGRIANDRVSKVLRQTLASGSEDLRSAAAAACLIAAETELARGRAAAAARLYAAVRNAKVPISCRTAAVRGAILAIKSRDRSAFLAELLRSENRLIRNAALMTLREVPSSALAEVLNAELEKAAPELQVQLILALQDCHNDKSIAAVKAQVSSNETEVRKTALVVLGQIGGPADVAVFLDAVTKNRSSEEADIARRNLERMEGWEVDSQILRALATANETALRIKLIRLVATRGMTNATPELFRQASAPDTKIRVAAIDGLKAVAGTQDLPTLISYTRSCMEEAVRDSAEAAMVSLCQKSIVPQDAADLVLAELSRTTEPAQRNCWLGVLTSLGSAKVLPILRADLDSANGVVAGAAITHLSNWPDSAPIEDLLVVLESSSDSARRALAFRGAVGLATNAADERQQPDEIIVEWLQRADKAAHTVQERWAILSGLGRLSTIESFRLLVGHLDSDSESEAGVPLVGMSLSLARQGHAIEVKDVLDNLAKTGESEDLRKKAQKVATTILKEGLLVSLFDGGSLAGWEGNMNVWRVRDGMIVGGSMDGNPQNEFLASLQTYTNFVLRLEYKLIGTTGFVNSGVQIHSVRLQQPSHEMKGFQADIGAGHSGCLYDESRRNKFVARGSDKLIKELEKPGDWSRYEIRCSGPRIQIWLNGTRTLEYIETDPTVPLYGLIALQIHGGSKAEVSFKNILIQRL